MFNYYLRLAIRSLRRNPALSALMVIAIGLGIGASITTLTVLHLLSGDPIPQKSATLFYPQLDPQDQINPKAGGEPPRQLTFIDAMNLLAAKRADRQAVMVGGTIALHPDSIRPFYADARYTSADFFPMFATPFLQGGPWSAADDDARANVAVISKKLDEKLFGAADSIGKTLRIKDKDFRIVGVLDHWRPTPQFYDLEQSRFGAGADIFLPFSTAHALDLGVATAVNCWGKDFDTDNMETAPCTWLQFWVEIDSPDKVRAYRDFLTSYSQEQKSLGRFQLPPNVRLRGLMEWLDFRHVVPSDVRLQVWLAFGFLVVCLVNTVGLLLAKFLRRSGEISVRRALGASRGEVFKQFLMEAAVIGLAGGVLGLLLALAGLWVVRQQPASYADLAHLDLPMFLTTFGLAITASLIAGLLPAWRACSVPPAIQLKTN